MGAMIIVHVVTEGVGKSLAILQSGGNGFSLSAAWIAVGILVVVLVVLFAAGFLRSRGREGSGVEGAEPQRPEQADPHAGSYPIEVYKSVGALQEKAELKILIYTPEEYEDQLGGDGKLRDRGFIGAVRTYRQVEGEGWLELPPGRAAELLELRTGEYEEDAGRSALLVRRLPPGLPASVQDRFRSGD